VRRCFPDSFSGAFALTAKSDYSVKSGINLAPGQIFMKFGICVLFQNLSENSRFITILCELRALYSGRVNQNTRFMLNSVFFLNRAVYETMNKNMAETERPQMAKCRKRKQDNLGYIPTPIICNTYCFQWGTRWHSWLRHCSTSRKVAGSIPDGVIRIFH